MVIMERRESQQDRRRAIAEKAEAVFYREGFAKVGIDRVAEAAGVALATLYRHFRGRQELVVAAMEERERRYFAALDRAAEGLSGEARVLSLFEGLSAWAAESGGNGCLFLRAAAAHPDEAAVRAVAFAHKRAYLALVRRRLLEAGWPAEQAAALAPEIFLLLEGAVATAGVLGDEGGRDIAIESARRLLRERPPRGE